MLGTEDKRGLTLIELGVAATILLLITVMVFQVMIPLMNRAQPGDDKQENLQRLLFLRHYLNSRLQGARVLAVDLYGLDYYLPQRVETDLGPLDQIYDSDVVLWEESRRYRVTTVDRGGDVVVVDGLSSAPENGRPLWNLGPGGDLFFDASSLPLLTLTARSRWGRYSGEVWERQIDLVVQHYAPE